MSNIWGLVRTNLVSSWEEYYIVIMTKKIFNNIIFLLTVNKLLNNIYIEVLGFQQAVLSLHSFLHSSNTLEYWQALDTGPGSGDIAMNSN